MSSRTWQRLEWALAFALLLAGSTTWCTLQSAAAAKAAEVGRREAQFEHLATVRNGRAAVIPDAALSALDGLYPGCAVVRVQGPAGAVLGLDDVGGAR